MYVCMHDNGQLAILGIAGTLYTTSWATLQDDDVPVISNHKLAIREWPFSG